MVDGLATRGIRIYAHNAAHLLNQIHLSDAFLSERASQRDIVGEKTIVIAIFALS